MFGHELSLRRLDDALLLSTIIRSGPLPRDRFEAWLKLRRELRFLERKQNVRARLEEHARWKKIHKAAREHMKQKYGNRASRRV